MKLGANVQKNGSTTFYVWAPNFETIDVKIEGKTYPMERRPKGYFFKEIPDSLLGKHYVYKLPDGREYPDPVSRSLPKGHKGPTAICSPESFQWSDSKWEGITQEDLIFYECHVGTFTPQGTFLAIIEKLPYLKNLGITCLELMPIIEFPGRCNWGYDGVSLYAPHHLYGTPDELKLLIDRAHAHGIGIALDLVYNHFGPEGAFAAVFAPYLTDKYGTPWGKGINFDGAGSDEVREFILQNALYWIHEFHIDAIRLDALHALFDFSPKHFLKELSSKIGRLERKIYLIGESDLNDSRLIRSSIGLDALWNEDFHHALHVTLTKEQQNYYQDYNGMKDLAKVIEKGVLYQGQYSKFRNRAHGNSFRGISPKQLISFAQNHDQIGNRVSGNRISTLIPLEFEKVMAVILLLSPYLPLLFMGQEYGEKNPFEYFVDYDSKELMQSVYEGRKREFQFDKDLPHPDFHAFERSKLSWNKNEELLSFYKELIQLRKRISGKKVVKIQYTETSLYWEYENLSIFCKFAHDTSLFPCKGRPLLQTEGAAIFDLS